MTLRWRRQYSPEKSGTRCLIFLDAARYLQTILLIYHKGSLPKKQGETAYLLQEVEKQFPQFWEAAERQDMNKVIKLINWNVEWAEPEKRQEILRRVKSQKPEIVCLTEAPPDLLPGDSINTGFCPGSGNPEGCKVLLWSAQPWYTESVINELDDNPSFPFGRFVSGVTRTSLGDLLVIGICIPYAGSRRSEGVKQWQDHKDYLRALESLLAKLMNESRPFILVGDF